MSLKEFESANIIPPLENSAAMKSQAAIVVSTAGVVQGLSGLFGGTIGDGHFLTLQADGAKMYVKFAANSAGSIDLAATGTGAGVAWPIPDGVAMPVVPIVGRETATGVATLCNYSFVHARVATTSPVATAILRFYRSSLAPQQDAGVLRAP
jgi:hypothetical protein